MLRAAPPVTSGFTNAYAGRVLLRDGRQAFLKAAGPETPFPVTLLGREAQVLEALAQEIPAVPMIGSASASDGGRVLALEWVEGHLPGLPWTQDEIALAGDTDALRVSHQNDHLNHFDCDRTTCSSDEVRARPATAHTCWTGTG